MSPRALFLAFLVSAAPAAAQEPVDTAVIAQIRREGFEHSHVMALARTLSDVYGPRLAGSRQYRRAADWARATLAGMGLANATLEPWGRPGPGWELDGFSIEVLEPSYLRVTAFPRAWSQPTAGVVSGTPVLVSIRSDADFAAYHGKLRGAIVLNGAAAPPDTTRRFASPAHRFSDAELDSLGRIVHPEIETFWQEYDGWVAAQTRGRRIARFFKDEGVAALREPSRNPFALGAQGWWSHLGAAGDDPPSFVVAREHYDRLVHLLDAGVPPRLVVRLDAHFTADTVGYDVVAELPGTEPRLATEVVMLGGHFDSWAAGTGATDNGAGSAVAMEVMRILKAIRARPRRPIRIALWDGEEASDHYAGSEGYVTRHFANL